MELETELNVVSMVNQFVASTQHKLDLHRKQNFPSLGRRLLSIEYKDKWAKIVARDEGSKGGSVYAWIALKNFETKELGPVTAGDIHKAASWKKPAKHARGSVLRPETWTCAGPYSIEYLRGGSCAF